MSISFTSLVGTCSSHALQELLYHLFPQRKAELETIQQALADETLSAQAKVRALKRTYGKRLYATLKKQVEALGVIIDTDMNVPILEKVLASANVTPPTKMSFQNLVLWVYIHHQHLWHVFLVKSYVMCSSRQFHECKIEEGLFKLKAYEEVEAMQAFEEAASILLAPLAIGEYTKLIFDDYVNGVYRAILYVSPEPFAVMTCDCELEEKFRFKPNTQALKIVLAYHEKTRVFTLIGKVSNKKVRIRLANAWARCFTGGSCIEELPKKRFDLRPFLFMPEALPIVSPLLKSVRIKSMMLADRVGADVIIGSFGERFDANRARKVLAIMEGASSVAWVALSVELNERTHGLTNFEVSLSESSLTLKEACHYVDLRNAILKTLEAAHVLRTTHEL